LDGQWRRQYPIHFRRLRDNQFSRWQWIEYDWIAPGAEDRRRESRRVQEDTIEVGSQMPEKERATFLAPFVMGSTAEAASKGMTLTLIRPVKTKFRVRSKNAQQIDDERKAYEEAARQKSFLDPDLKALTPCPYGFHFDWTDVDGKTHRATCDDWETAAMFYNWERRAGTQAALDDMSALFNEKYPQKGMAFAMGTHSRYPDKWLLVGVLRLDNVQQSSLPF
jgi:hypothetical protein